ncbi:hypothetical protein BLOT_014681 [Blomia tropicalis]|nr:hypothetical protein BLOT_014681 [Blomia tropicalis]
MAKSFVNIQAQQYFCSYQLVYLSLLNHLLLLTDFDNFGIDSYRFSDSETIKAIFEFVRCTVFEIFEVKDHLWGNATLRNFNKTNICKKVTFLGRFHFLNREFNVFSN